MASESSAATVECNGPRDCVGTERGCSHCDPHKFAADQAAAQDRYVVGWENRAGTVGGNEVVSAASERRARNIVKRLHGRWTTRITAVEKVNA